MAKYQNKFLTVHSTTGGRFPRAWLEPPPSQVGRQAKFGTSCASACMTSIVLASGSQGSRYSRWSRRLPFHVLLYQSHIFVESQNFIIYYISSKVQQMLFLHRIFVDLSPSLLLLRLLLPLKKQIHLHPEQLFLLLYINLLLHINE